MCTGRSIASNPVLALIQKRGEIESNREEKPESIYKKDSGGSINSNVKFVLRSLEFERPEGVWGAQGGPRGYAAEAQWKDLRSRIVGRLRTRSKDRGYRMW